MQIMKEPPVKIAAEDLFELCIDSFTDEDRKKKFRAYTPVIRRHAGANSKMVPSRIDAFLEKVLPEQVDANEMKAIYEQKLVGSTPGRDYYDAILLSPRNCLCPICGENLATTLDHYLPKSKVPTLAVAPGNLVPACSDCNKNKTANLNADPENMPVHIYFDEIPDGIWLYADLGENLEATYRISCPADWEPGIRARVGKHLKFYKLQRLYSQKASAEKSDLIAAWEVILNLVHNSVGMDLLSIDNKRKLLHTTITGKREGAEKQDLNSWQAAFYRALEQNMDAVYAYFELA